MADGQANQDEVSEPEKDLKAQNPGQTTTGDIAADDIDPNDPHKVEKLAKAGRQESPDESSE